MARRLGKGREFWRFFVHEPYIFGLAVGAVALLFIQGELWIKALAILTGIVLCVIAALVRFVVLSRRDAQVEQNRSDGTGEV